LLEGTVLKGAAQVAQVPLLLQVKQGASHKTQAPTVLAVNDPRHDEQKFVAPQMRQLVMEQLVHVPVAVKVNPGLQTWQVALNSHDSQLLTLQVTHASPKVDRLRPVLQLPQ
jgi:hypothetical protein